MLDRELSYQMPFKRLLAVSRMAGRRAFAGSWRMLLLLVVAYFGALGLMLAFTEQLADWTERYGLHYTTPLVILMAAFLGGFWLLRRYGLSQMRQRADYDGMVRFRQEQDGLRFATADIEYIVKWRGLSQVMLIEDEGVLFSHGGLFFLVPNDAFRDKNERNELVRDILPRLSDESRDRSAKFIPAGIGRLGGTTGA